MTSFIGLFSTTVFWILNPSPFNCQRRALFRIGSLFAIAGCFEIATSPSVSAASISINNVLRKSEKVTLRVQVLNDNRSPNEMLVAENFLVSTTDDDGNNVILQPQDVQIARPTNQRNPDPAEIVILLDMSNSMSRADAQSGETKLESAIEGVRAFVAQAKREGLPLQISLVPFGDPGEFACDYTYTVDEKTIQDSALSIKRDYSQIMERLKILSQVPVCSTTNIYQPVAASVDYLGQTPRSSFNPQIGEDTYPQKSVILLSDGFHAYRDNEPVEFEALTQKLQDNSQITVHTIGYGESLLNILDRAECSLSKDSLAVDSVLTQCAIYDEEGRNQIGSFIIDEPRLTTIAESTVNGIALFPENADQVKANLIDFLKTLRAYEISFLQPGADKASQHQVTVNIVSDDPSLDGLTVKENYRMRNIGYISLPFVNRMFIMLFALLLGYAGLNGFFIWSRQLKKQAERHL